MNINEKNYNRRFTDDQRVRVLLLAVLFLIAVILGLSTYAAAKLKQPYKQNAPEQNIVIPKGTSSTNVADILRAERIISGERIFLYYLILKGASGSVQAGEYQLSASMTIPEIVQRLTKGEVVANEIRVMINEGWNLTKIAKAVEDNNIGTAEEFYRLVGTPPHMKKQLPSETIIGRHDFLKDLTKVSSLEGYLYPDTYFISRAGGVEELVEKMLDNFEKRINAEIRNQIEVQGKTLHQVITIASLIEGEVGRNISGRSLTAEEIEEISKERKIVSDVFWTRLSIGMGLESDATVSYALGKPKRQATFKDLETDSPYNTYMYQGLPPGPINNPGMESILAAINPANTNYLYFLSDPEGRAYFGRTLEEHNQNRRLYLPAN